MTPSRSFRRSRLGIIHGCDFRRIEQFEMYPERGRRGKDLPRASGGELVAEIRAESDPEKPKPERGSGAIVGISIADER